ncbi:MAG TPA: DUF4349 domain-containing protein [Fibrobacteria bacterium]|nr:DUF4349 domain-containing protein [Fibrobacteria bacterium]
MNLLPLIALLLSGGATPSATHRQAEVALECARPDSVGDRILLRAQAVGGWLANRDDHSLTVKVPTDSLESFARWTWTLAKRVDYSLEVQDLSERIVDLKVSIASRDTLLRAYLALVDSSTNSYQLRDVERMGANLAVEIGSLRGQLSAVLSQARWAELTVRLGQLGGTSSTLPSPSPFAWINETGLAPLREESP